MTKRLLCIMMLVMAMTTATIAVAEHRIGGGVNYWMTLDDIDISDVDENGFSLLASYQYWTGLFGVELDLEFLPDRFGDSAVAPEAYLLIGRSLYAGLGMGIMYSDSSFEDEPFFALRAGLNLEILPGIYVDISGNYRFNDSAQLEDEATDIDTDTIFLGAAVRLAL